MDGYIKKIGNFYKSNKRMPSFSEIAKLFGFKSKNAAFKLVNKLVDGGFIEKDRDGHLLPKALLGGVFRLGTVEAGIPSDTEEMQSDLFSLDEMLVKDESFMLTVKGESMKDAGIYEGDMVLVERKNVAKDGDIVIAEVDGGWTMKYYRERKGKVYLEPANKKFKNIYPEQELKVAAIVKAIIRKF